MRKIEPVLRQHETVEHGFRLRHSLRGFRDGRRLEAGLQHAAARSALGGEQVERIAIDFEPADLVLEFRDLNPLCFSGCRLSNRGHVEPHVRPHIGEDEEGVGRSARRVDEGHLDVIERDLRIEPALHQHRIVRRIIAQLVEARLAVEIAIRRIRRAGELGVKEARCIIEPAGRPVLRVGNGLGEVLACRGLQDVQHRILAAILGNAIGDIFAAWRGIPPVERIVAAACGHGGGIDKNAVCPLLAQEQLEAFGAGGTLFEEQIVASSCTRLVATM